MERYVTAALRTRGVTRSWPQNEGQPCGGNAEWVARWMEHHLLLALESPTRYPGAPRVAWKGWARLGSRWLE